VSDHDFPSSSYTATTLDEIVGEMDIHWSLESRRKFQMKRIAALTLLVALSAPWSMPVKAQRISVAEGERRSRKAAKKQEKINKKAAKKQRKAMKKAAKAQRKANKKANRSYR
jgi:hypothetical protein